ncbi:MAG: xylulose kinase [Microbacteriaceae bacterium]|nr:xylulose kinase [Microbacteriaceae bacterium]
MREAFLGVDIGTSSSKGVLVAADGTVLATATREHQVSRPGPGMVEMDASVWWEEFVSISRELNTTGDTTVVAVGLSGMGPCVLVTDSDNRPLRPAILYGVDSRATAQIARLAETLGSTAIVDRCGSALSTQAVGPKLWWLRDQEPEVYAASRRLFMPSSWLLYQLTGNYVLDYHSASQCTPMFDTTAEDWFRPWCDVIAPELELPGLLWAGEVAGTIHAAAAAETTLPLGIPVITGTIDAWSEAVSVGATEVGDLMLMYGTTMFLINTVHERLTSPTLWSTLGAVPGTRNLAGGMATSGAITGWLRELFGSPDFSDLLANAEQSGPGANGLIMLPYFAGERTPIADPDARGVIAGLTIGHTPGDLYRAALEATAFGVRHNVQGMRDAGGDIQRVVAVGGGTRGRLWTQLVSDITGLEQHIPTVTIGASFGAAFLAARSTSEVSIDQWNPIAEVLTPNLELAGRYDELYDLYRRLYPATESIVHALAALQNRA